MPQKTHIWGLDIWRGIAALLVFLFHYWTFFSADFSGGILQTFFKAGHLGVDMFFVLSGFLVTLSLFTSQNFFAYLEKRLRRILPLAFMVLFGIFLYQRSFESQNFLDLGVHLLFLQGFFMDFYHSMNPVMWTLSVEMLFYLLLPFLWMVLARKNIHHFLAISAGLVLMSFVWRAYVFFFFAEGSASEKIFLSEQLWGRFDQFFLGILLAVVVVKKITFSPLVNRIFLELGAALFLLFYLLFAHYESGFRDFFFGQVFFHAGVGLGFFGVLLWFIQAQFPMGVQKISVPFLFFGKISYGLYLFHFPVLSVVHKLPLAPVGGFFLALAITVLFSWLSFEFWEKRFLLRRSEKKKNI